MLKAVADHAASADARDAQGASDPFLDRLAALSDRDRDRTVHALAASWSWHAGGRDGAFTVIDLAAAGVDADAAQRFLDAFSVTFGAREDSKFWEKTPHVLLAARWR
jgi:hypothetical protein